MALKPETFVPLYGYIEDQEGNIFQILNEDGSDWDNEATQKEFEAFLAAKAKA